MMGEVVYLLDKAYWARPGNRSRPRVIANYAFQNLGLTCLICLIGRENIASLIAGG